MFYVSSIHPRFRVPFYYRFLEMTRQCGLIHPCHDISHLFSQRKLNFTNSQTAFVSEGFDPCSDKFNIVLYK